MRKSSKFAEEAFANVEEQGKWGYSQGTGLRQRLSLVRKDSALRNLELRTTRMWSEVRFSHK